MIYVRPKTEVPFTLEIALLFTPKAETAAVARPSKPLLRPPCDWLNEMVCFPASPPASKYETCEFGTPKTYVCFECGAFQNARPPVWRLPFHAEAVDEPFHAEPCPNCAAVKTECSNLRDPRIGKDLIKRSALKLQRWHFARLWEYLGGKCQRRLFTSNRQRQLEVAVFPVPPYNVLWPTVRLPLKLNASCLEVMQAFRPPCPSFWNAAAAYVKVADPGYMVPVPLCNLWTTCVPMPHDYIIRCPHVFAENKRNALQILSAEFVESFRCAQQAAKLHLAFLLWNASPLSSCSWSFLLTQLFVCILLIFTAHHARKRMLGISASCDIASVEGRISNVMNTVLLVVGLMVAFLDGPIQLLVCA